jgi:hypothetical protein
MPAMRRLVLTLALVLLCAVTAAAQPWPAAGLAIRTNGSSFRDGECLRVTLLALDDVPGPLVARVGYDFQDLVPVKNRAGKESTILHRRLVERPAGAVLDGLGAGDSVVLDDSFCFGVGSAPGPYDLTVALEWGGARTGSLATCVEFQPHSGDPAPAVGRCGFALRGVSRRDDADVLTLEGQFPPNPQLRLVFLRGDHVLHLLEAGLVPTGPDELTFVLPSLGPDGAGPVDLLLQDQWQSRAATLARVPLQR